MVVPEQQLGRYCSADQEPQKDLIRPERTPPGRGPTGRGSCGLM
jgi:hypothetical protein